MAILSTDDNYEIMSYLFQNLDVTHVETADRAEELLPTCQDPLPKGHSSDLAKE
jgi:hypothetical protein